MEYKPKILIVDDKKENLYVLEKVLSETGAELIRATNGNDALRASLNHDFALTILDVQMPGMDGYELAELLRGEESTQHLPIIFMSAVYSDDFHVSRSYEAGAVDFITKPFNPTILLAKVNIFLQIDSQKKAIDRYRDYLEDEVQMRTAHLQQEINERNRSEEKVKTLNRELSIKNRISKIFLTVSDDEMYGEVLQIILDELDSPYGLFGYIGYKGDLICPSLTKDVWDECQIPGKDIVFPREEWCGIWGQALLEKKSLFSNKPFKVPEGHVPINRALDVPIIHSGVTIGLLMIANRPTDYTKEDVAFCEMLAEYISPTLSARLAMNWKERQRKQAEKKLKQYSENLEQMVSDRTNKLDEALERAEQARDRIDGILKSVGDGLIVTDTRNEVVLMNRAVEEILGLRLSTAINRPIDYVIEDANLREKIVCTLNKKATGYIYDFKLPDDDPKQSRIMRARTSTILDSNGNAAGVITLINDVTKEREVDRMKTEFISMAAHELRTPLTSIQGFSELLLSREDMKRDDKKRYLRHINKQALHLAAIMSDLLDISRIESGQGFTLNREWRRPCEILGRVVSEFEGLTDKHGFEVINPKDQVDLYIDRVKMEQVTRNLISNAVKYSPDGGRIRIAGEVLDGDFLISFEDQGQGMSLEQKEKIFDKFYRADASNTATEGSGLGMSIVKYIVEAHGGEVWVESEKNKGTKVSLTIPLNNNHRGKK